MLCQRCQPGAISAQRWSYQLGLEDGVRSPLCRIFPQVLLIVIEKLCQLFHLRGAFIVETQECFLVIKDSNMVEPKEKLDLFIWALTSFLFSSHLHFNLAADWLSVFDRKYCHWHFQVTSYSFWHWGEAASMNCPPSKVLRPKFLGKIFIGSLLSQSDVAMGRVAEN